MFRVAKLSGCKILGKKLCNIGPTTGKKIFKNKVAWRRHDTQLNDIQLNDTQHKSASA